MKKELSILHHANANLRTRCLSSHNDSHYEDEPNQFEILNTPICKLMLLKEENSVNEIRIKQSKKCLKILQGKKNYNQIS